MALWDTWSSTNVDKNITTGVTKDKATTPVAPSHIHGATKDTNNTAACDITDTGAVANPVTPAILLKLDLIAAMLSMTTTPADKRLVAVITQETEDCGDFLPCRETTCARSLMPKPR